MPDAAELLAAYDAQLRGRVPDALPAGVTVERDGPLVRFASFAWGGFVGYRDLGGIEGEELDELIARQVRYFADRGERFEWKLHGHDHPADLPERLRAAGFEPEEQETIVIAPVEQIAGEPVLPDGVSIERVGDRRGIDGIVELEEAVWGEEHRSLGDDLEQELAAGPDTLAIFVAEAGGRVVSAGWIRFEGEFGTLWGGSTLAEWRRRGIYRALVAHRARLAADRGCRWLEVDASDDSRPILERLGFVAVTTTTPYVWKPEAEAG